MSKSKAIFGLFCSILLFSLAMMVQAAVELASFEGQWDEADNQITLFWETGSETDHSVFKVWRSTENLTITEGQIDTDQAQNITEELAGKAIILSPSGGCNATGNDYEYTDDTVNQDEADYYYYLESFNCQNQVSEFHGALNNKSGLQVHNPAFEEEPSPTPTRTPSIVYSHWIYLPIIKQLTKKPLTYAFEPLSPSYLPNCSLTQVKGTIRDSDTHERINGVTVRVWYDDAAFHEFYSLPSGEEPTLKPGEWQVLLAPYPKAGQWYVQVVNRETGAPLSDMQTVYTDNGPCSVGESGHQVVIQDFIKYDEPAVPSPPTHTPRPITATPSQNPTATPIVTPTPSGIVLLEDDFEDGNRLNWIMDENSVIENGVFSVELAEPATFWQSFPHGIGLLDDYTYSASVTLLNELGSEEQDASAGLIFRGQGEDSFYLFEINGRGEFRLRIRNGQEWIEELNWLSHPAILTAGVSNELSVTVENEIFFLSVNGSLVVQGFEMPPEFYFMFGTIGLAAQAGELPFSVEFDNVLIAR